MAQARTTIDHEEIKSWVEERGGCPAHVKGSGNGDDPGILRIDYSGFSGKHSLEEISWETFFDAFEDNDLAFLYQENGKSRFSKLISRDSAKLTGGKSNAKAKGKTQGKSKAKTGARSKSKDRIDAIELLKEQHREVEELFERAESAKSASQKESVLKKLADALAAHTKIEETLFYPAVFAEQTESELREAVEEHLVAKRLLADLMSMKPSDSQFKGKLTVLKEIVEHHVEEEEKTLFPMVRKEEIEDLEVLGKKMQQRYKELMKSSPREAVPKETRAAQAAF